MKTLSNLIASLMLMLLVAGCGLSPATSPLPDASPPSTPTTVSSADGNQTDQPTPTPAVLQVRNTPLPTFDNQQPGPSESTVPLIAGVSEIAILRPGQLSRLSSPLRVIASLSNPTDSRVLISLYGEDGRTLAERVFDVLPYNDPINGNVILDLDFSIDSLAETGRLEFKAYDQFGRLRALNSVTLILLSNGPNDRNYAPEQQERLELQIPFPGQTEAPASPLLLSGLVRLTLDAAEVPPLTVLLVDEAGLVVAEGLAPVVPMPGTRYAQFVAQIEYQVETSTPVLLILGVREGRLPGLVYARSFPLLLNP